MNNLVYKTLLAVVVSLATLFTITKVAQSGWIKSADWEIKVDPSPTCREGIEIGLLFVEGNFDPPYTLKFYADTIGLPTIGEHEMSDFIDMQNSVPPQYCSGYEGTNPEPRYCGGPDPVTWDFDLDKNEQLLLVITDNSGNELDNARSDNPKIVECVSIDLAQTGEGNISSIVSDAIVFQVETYNQVNNGDGEGIDYVDMRIIGPDGTEVRQKNEFNKPFCVFDGEPNCNKWSFSQNNYRWPGGERIKNGAHTLRATAYPDSNGSEHTQEYAIDIQLPIVGAWQQIGDNAVDAIVTDALVGEVAANVGDPSNGHKEVDRVDITLVGPDGQSILTRTEFNTPFCLFGGNNPCPIWDFAQNSYNWPNGQPIQHEIHTLRATIYADDAGEPDNRSVTIEEFGFSIQLPAIETTLAQTGPNSTSTLITDTLALQVEATLGGNVDGTNIDRVEMLVTDPDGDEVHESIDSSPKYCAFGGGNPNCTDWTFVNQDNQWPGGAQVANGTHTLSATVYTRDGRNTTTEFGFLISLEELEPTDQMVFLPFVIR